MTPDEAPSRARAEEARYRDEVLPELIDAIVEELNGELVHLGLPPGCRLVYVPASAP